MKLERRFIKGAEVRVVKRGEGDNKQPVLEGYGAVFGEDYVLYDSKTFRMVERVKPGAFTRALEEKQDVRCCLNHNPDNVLGRTANGTMSLDQDDKGLAYKTTLDERTSIAKDVSCFVERGDVTGSSFAFSVVAQTWTESEKDGFTIYQREIEDVDLFEMGPVLFPAYEGTNVGVRAGHNLAAELRSAAWAEGMPAELRSKIIAHRDTRSEECSCRCVACARDNNCDDCVDNMIDCGDPENCSCASKRSAAGGAREDAGDVIEIDRARMELDVNSRMRRLGIPTA